MQRIVVAHSPFGSSLLFKRLEGTEALSTVFDFDVELVSEDASLDARQILGKGLGLAIEVDSGQTRYLHGEVVRFSYIGQELGGPRLARYRLQLRPWLWYLGRNRDCKIYQNQSVVEILDEVLGSYPGYQYRKQLSGSYANYEFCVQYEESDLDFIQRLMEQEGIYYYIEHQADHHVVVLCDDVSAHEMLPHQSNIAYYPEDSNVLATEQAIYAWRSHQQLQGVEYVVDDYDFTKSAASLRQQRRVPYSITQANREIYDWQAGYADPDQGEHYVRVRVEQAQSAASLIEGESNVRALAPGYFFHLKQSPRQQDCQDYLLVAVRYELSEAGYYSGDATGEGRYLLTFSAQPADIPYRAPFVTSKPKTNGPQTAIVTGPAGAEIYTDKFQRVKVLFRWDRYGLANEQSSCWIRVSNDSAGAGFGSVVPPRVGQEVVVDFIGGNPDRPVIIGRVYNDQQMPAFTPSPTQSGFVSRSFGGGGAANANHLIFDDAAGAELVHLHAERNAKNTTEMNYDQQVGVDHHLQVGNNHQIEIGNNLMTVIKAMEQRLVQAEQRIQVNSNALHQYDSNFEQRISGMEERVTEAEQRIRVNSHAIHQYQGNLDSEIVGNETKRVKSNHHLEVDGAASNQQQSLTCLVSQDSKETVQGNKDTTVQGTFWHRVKELVEITESKKFTVKPYSMGVTGMSVSGTLVSASATLASASATGVSASYKGHEIKTKRTKEDIAAKERSIRLSEIRSEVLVRSMIGVKKKQAGMQREMSGLKNSMSALDSRTNGLTSVS